jgi:hypothetical protein
MQSRKEPPSNRSRLRSGDPIFGAVEDKGRSIRPHKAEALSIRKAQSRAAKSSLAIVAISAHIAFIEFRLTGLRQHLLQLSALDLSLTS